MKILFVLSILRYAAILLQPTRLACKSSARKPAIHLLFVALFSIAVARNLLDNTKWILEYCFSSKLTWKIRSWDCQLVLLQNILCKNTLKIRFSISLIFQKGNYIKLKFRVIVISVQREKKLYNFKGKLIINFQ